jgi:transitional endoplasmic reticulum ATPase
MRMNQAERIRLKKSMTSAHADRSLLRKLTNLSDPRDTLSSIYAPLLVFDSLFIVWYLAMYYLSPLDLGGNSSAGKFNFFMSATQYFVFFVHAMAVVAFLGYVAQVLLNVPWGTKYPLVSPPFVMPIERSGLHLVAIGFIGLWKGGEQILHPLLFIAEGCVVHYFYLFQPALGFIKWTNADQEKFDQERPTASAVASTRQNSGDTDEVYSVPFKAEKSEINFNAICGMAAIKEKLLDPAKLILGPRTDGVESPRNGILLHGEPGNGKTVFAKALAGELNIPIIEVTYGRMSSQWVGNMPKVLANTFAYAKRCAPCVLFIDEIDSFIKSREMAGGSSEDLKITNSLLTEIVNLRGHAVVLMAATNFIANLDAAAIREGRFDYKVEITPPDEEARIGIVAAAVKRYASNLVVDPADSLSVAKRWNGFSVSRLMAVCKTLPDVAKKTGSPRIELAQWMQALREVQGRKGKLPSETKSLNDLVLDTQTRSALDLITSRLKDVSRVESMGGTLPSGVLFHGPSGTGKTAAVRAMAKEVGWAFLAVAGPDLIADRTKLDKLFAEAKDIRPTIVFVDEADDILRNRQYSTTPDFVNKLLTIMDGADDKVKDIVWVAATNNPDQIDPALLRSGRFTEKVLFSTPPKDQIPRHIASWLKVRSVSLDPIHDVFDFAESLTGQTIADIEGVLQYALNSAIARTPLGSSPVIDQTDMRQALRVVLNHIET